MKVKTITTVRVTLNKRESNALVNALHIALDTGFLPSEDTPTVSSLIDSLPPDTAISTNRK